MIPEIDALDSRSNVIRIPDQLDVPITRRVRRLIDTEAFQRLSGIRQLGVVSMVYPGATHTRFEHSLGVYRNTLLFCRRLLKTGRIRTLLASGHLESLVVAGLLHDIGHWPWCHAIEDMELESVPRHEQVAAWLLQQDELRCVLESDWSCDPDVVSRLIVGTPRNLEEQFLCSVLSGPIDVDKLDYLYRDSLHCGVPYGRNFDAGRLVNSLCPRPDQSGIGISPKGKTAAEMMVFARYVMFSEVYWHHAVRSATVMLQRTFLDWLETRPDGLSLQSFAKMDDRTMEQELLQSSHQRDSKTGLLLMGRKRLLYKRKLDCSAHENAQLHQAVAHQPFRELVELSKRLAERLAVWLGVPVAGDEILIDAPPPGLEVQFKVHVIDGESTVLLEELSPVVKVLAQHQFDDFVKRVRVFVHPRLAESLLPQTVEEELSGLLEL